VTVEQRRQAIDFGKIRGTGMPIPTGNIQATQRAHICNVYYEIPVPSVLFYWTNRNLVAGGWSKKVSPASTWQNRGIVAGQWSGRIPPPDSATLEE
jgi:hypothetical protein